MVIGATANQARTLNTVFVVASLALAAALLITFGLLWLNWPALTFPSKDDVQSILEAFDRERDIVERIKLLDRLFYRLHFANARSMDESVFFGLNELKSRYLLSGDEAILIAIENADYYGAFQTSAMDTYAELAESPAFWMRYDANPAVQHEVQSLLQSAQGLSPEARRKIASELAKRGESAI